MDFMCFAKIMHRVSDPDWFMWASVREKNLSVYRKCCQVHLIHSDTHTHTEVNKISRHLRSHHIWIWYSWVHCDRLQLGQALPGFCFASPIRGHHLIWPAEARPVITSGGVTNHITSTDSLQSLCSLDPVLRLCPYLSEWRFMLWPVGGRVMWYKSRLSETEWACVSMCMWSIKLTLTSLQAGEMLAGLLLQLAWFCSGNWAEVTSFL